MITESDYELASVALVSADNEAQAVRMLRDECGWTIGHAVNVVRFVRAYHARTREATEGSE